MTGFEQASDRTLRKLRRNLLGGIDLVAASIAEGTFHHVGPKGSAPASQAGQITLALLDGVDAELARRSASQQPQPEPAAAASAIE